MEILYLLNSYIKYAYLLAFIGIVIALIKLLKNGLIPLGLKAAELSKSVDSINNNLLEVSKSAEKINDTVQNKLPLILDILAVFSLFKSLLKIRKRKSTLAGTVGKYIYSSASSGAPVGSVLFKILK